MKTTATPLFLICILLALCVPAVAQQVASPPGVPELKVECDQGDNLHAAIRRVAQLPFARIRVTGVCEGNFSVSSPNVLEIISDDPLSGAMLRSEGPVLSAEGPGYLSVTGVTLFGATGINAIGERRVVILRDSAIDAEWFGVRMESGAAVLIEDTEIHGTLSAINASEAVVVLERARLRAGEGPVVSASKSEAYLLNSEISNGTSGVSARLRSNVTVAGSKFRENGLAHLRSTEDSRLVVINASVGSEDDPTNIALSAQSGSALEVYGDDPDATIWGSAIVTGDAYMTLVGTTLNGSISLREFSRLHVEGTVTGNVGCQTGADAVCGPFAQAATVDCASAEPICRLQTPGRVQEVNDDPPIPAVSPRPEIFKRPSKRSGIAPRQH